MHPQDLIHHFIRHLRNVLSPHLSLASPISALKQCYSDRKEDKNLDWIGESIQLFEYYNIADHECINYAMKADIKKVLEIMQRWNLVSSDEVIEIPCSVNPKFEAAMNKGIRQRVKEIRDVPTEDIEKFNGKLSEIYEIYLIAKGNQPVSQ